MRCKAANGVFPMADSMVGYFMPTLCHNSIPSSAEVAKLVDAADSKSAGAKHRAGSIPAFGTTKRPALFHDSAGFFFGPWL